eukprot:9475902-Pyramimonas_sp.AAC.1
MAGGIHIYIYIDKSADTLTSNRRLSCQIESCGSDPRDMRGSGTASRNSTSDDAALARTPFH